VKSVSKITKPTVASGTQAPAGHVKGYADTVLEILAAEEDHAQVRKEFFEGKPLTKAETETRARVFTIVMKAANQFLIPTGVHIYGVTPESQGFGARFFARDRRREWYIDYRFDDVVRLNPHKIDTEDFVRETVVDIVDAMIQQRGDYLRRGGLDS